MIFPADLWNRCLLFSEHAFFFLDRTPSFVGLFALQRYQPLQRPETPESV